MTFFPYFKNLEGGETKPMFSLSKSKVKKVPRGESVEDPDLWDFEYPWWDEDWVEELGEP